MMTRRFPAGFHARSLPKPAAWLLGLCVCLSLLPCKAGAATTTKDKLNPLSKPALRELNDGMGWTKPQYYETVQAVDLDGDGQSEVLARWIDGLHIYRFADAGALIDHSFLPQLSDAAGFSKPSWYSTIRAGVLAAGSGQADVLVRKADGIHVFRYDSHKSAWNEVPSAGVRPFADHAADGTDWSQPEYYETIRVADLNHDGIVELIGRGKRGLAVYSFNNGNGEWQPLTMEGDLADGDGNERPSTYRTIQLVDVDGDGRPEVLARTETGVVTLRWTGKGFVPLTQSGPFAKGSQAEAELDSLTPTIRSIRDERGQTWLYGIAPSGGGAGQREVQIFKWTDGNFRPVSSIAVRGGDIETQDTSSVLLAANITGDTTPEFLLRTPAGLLTYDAQGKQLKAKLTELSDAKGWNLKERFSTLMVGTMRRSDSDRRNGMSPVLLGRDGDGLKAFKFTDRWIRAADSSFPNFCSGGQNAPSCIAYGCLSQIAAGSQAGVPVTDIRSLYPENALNANFWTGVSGTLFANSKPTGAGACSNVDPASWLPVEQQLSTEAGYLAAIDGWFSNNNEVLTRTFESTDNVLNNVVNNLNKIDGQTTVNTQWLGLSLDVAAGLAGLIPEGGAGFRLVITVLKDVINFSRPGDEQNIINNIYGDLESSSQAAFAQNATQRQGYASSWDQMQQLGSLQIDWSKTGAKEIDTAVSGAINGYYIHFYRVISPSRWQVYWCSDSVDYRELPCRPYDTPDLYYCQYGNTQAPYSGYHSNATLSTGQFGPPLSWSSVDQLTGTGPNNLNAIWYMMMLGSNLGWDYPGYVLQKFNNHNQVDGELNFDYIQNGYPQQSSSCLGNGSTTGINTSSQSVMQSLIVAQANTNSLRPAYVRQLELGFADLEAQVQASTANDGALRTNLTQPLKYAEELLHRVFQGPTQAISATTPTHLWSRSSIRSIAPSSSRVRRTP